MQLALSLETGGVLSMLMPVTVMPGVELPATSLAGALVTLRSVPWFVMAMFDGQAATPEPRLPSARPGSSHRNLTLTRPLYQPASLGFAVGAPVIVGPLRSMLRSPTEAELELPALSETLLGALAKWRPSPVTVLVEGHPPSI